jgi:hypothetical protein
MKHFYFLLALLWLASTGRSAAQTQPTDSARQYLRSVFAPLDKSQLPAPYLEEYGYRLLPLRLFNGTLADSNRTSLSAWRQLFATVVSGTLTGIDTCPPWPTSTPAWLPSGRPAGPFRCWCSASTTPPCGPTPWRRSTPGHSSERIDT